MARGCTRLCRCWSSANTVGRVGIYPVRFVHAPDSLQNRTAVCRSSGYLGTDAELQVGIGDLGLRSELTLYSFVTLLLNPLWWQFRGVLGREGYEPAWWDQGTEPSITMNEFTRWASFRQTQRLQIYCKSKTWQNPVNVLWLCEWITKTRSCRTNRGASRSVLWATYWSVSVLAFTLGSFWRRDPLRKGLIFEIHLCEIVLATMGEEMKGPKWSWGDHGQDHGFYCSQNHGYRIALNIHTEASFQKPYELPESTQPFSLTVTHSQAATFCLGTASPNLNRQPALGDSQHFSGR